MAGPRIFPTPQLLGHSFICSKCHVTSHLQRECSSFSKHSQRLRKDPLSLFSSNVAKAIKRDGLNMVELETKSIVFLGNLKVFHLPFFLLYHSKKKTSLASSILVEIFFHEVSLFWGILWII